MRAVGRAQRDGQVVGVWSDPQKNYFAQRQPINKKQTKQNKTKALISSALSSISLPKLSAIAANNKKKHDKYVASRKAP